MFFSLLLAKNKKAKKISKEHSLYDSLSIIFSTFMPMKWIYTYILIFLQKLEFGLRFIFKYHKKIFSQQWLFRFESNFYQWSDCSIFALESKRKKMFCHTKECILIEEEAKQIYTFIITTKVTKNWEKEIFGKSWKRFYFQRAHKTVDFYRIKKFSYYSVLAINW